MPCSRFFLLLASIGALATAALAQPTITRFPNSQVIPVGGNVTFAVEATGTAPLSYQWSRGATALAGATSATYTVSNATAADAGIYAVTVTDASGTTRTFTPFAPGFGSGYNHTLYLKNDGSLWGIGADQFGQLGQGSSISYRPQPVRIAADVVAATGGMHHTLLLKTDGTLWTAGYNFYGQLGDGTTLNRPTPVQIATNVAAIAAGAHHSLFIKTDGTLWAMGNNGGQLGDGTSIARSSPVQVASEVRAIAAGASHSLFLKTDGTLWGMGGNNYGQLGDGTFTTRQTPVQIATGVTSIAAGATHTLFVKSDGTAWGCGGNSNGQLGDGFTASYRNVPVQAMLSGVQRVAAGAFHSAFLKTDGTLWGAGYNSYGQIGDQLGSIRATPTQFATAVTDMAGGEYSLLYRRSDGTLWALGYNGYGQFGDGTTSSRSTPGPILGPTDTPAVLVVNQPPAITTAPASGTINANTNHTLTVEVSGTAPFTYQWAKDGVAITGATGSSLLLPAFDLSRVGAYTVTVTNSVGSVTSAAAQLALRVPLTTGQLAAVGKSTSLLATPGGAGTISWEISTDGGSTWSTVTDGANFAGATTNRLSLLNVTGQLNNSLFRYRVTLGAASVVSSAALINTFLSPLALPTGLSIDRAGHLYVADAGAQTILKIDPNLRSVVLAGKSGETGSADGAGSVARFNEPGAFFLTEDGTLTVVDTANHTLRSIAPDGRVTTLAGSPGLAGSTDGGGSAARFNFPTGLAADLAGNFVVADQGNHTLRLVANATNVSTLAGRTGLGGTLDGTTANALFNQPGGVVVRRDNNSWINWGTGTNAYGTLFVADTGNHVVRVITPTGVVGTYVGLTGTAGTQNGSRTTSRFNRPMGLTMDPDGNLYIADTGNHAIRKVDVLGTVTTYAGTPGVRGHMDGPAAASLFNEPESLAFDSAKNLYVADTGNGLLRKVTPAGVVSTVPLLGNVPSITTQPASQSVVAGGSVTFSVAATGEGTLTYQWRKDGALLPGATAASYTLSSVASSAAGNYSVLVSNSWGSTASSDAALTVTAAPSNGGGGNSGGGTPTSGGGGGGGGGGAPSAWFAVLAGAALLARAGRRRA